MYPQPNVTDVPSLFSYANIVTDNWFWPLMLLTIYMIVYITLSTRTVSKQAFAVTSFFVGIIAAFMFVAGLIGELPLIITIVAAIGGFILLMFDQGSS